MKTALVRRNPEFKDVFANEVWQRTCYKHRQPVEGVFKGHLFKQSGYEKIKFSCFKEDYVTSFDERWVVLEISETDLSKYE